MTKQEAIDAMKAGKKVTHRYFNSKEYIKFNSLKTLLVFEDGVELTEYDFWSQRRGEQWNDGWSLFNDGPTEFEKEALAYAFKDTGLENTPVNQNDLGIQIRKNAYLAACNKMQDKLFSYIESIKGETANAVDKDKQTLNSQYFSGKEAGLQTAVELLLVHKLIFPLKQTGK